MSTINVTIQYFAILREERGLSKETFQTQAQNAAQLYQELKGRHGLSFPQDRLKVAINDEFASWKAPLSDGDDVVFIAPVAGG